MPVSKPSLVSPSKRKAVQWQRNGWRHAIYGPRPKAMFKDHYKGQWKDDKKEGKGMQLNRYGWMYEGDWLADRKHGYGVLSRVSKNGDIKNSYTGDWVEGKKHGYGGNWFEDGSYYEGSFSRNKRDGFGRIWYADGSYYQGTWKDNRYHGDGMLVQANCNRYEGRFANGKKNGHGIFYHLDSGQLQEGRWIDDVCVNSTIEDIRWRQSARYPTPYPIPKCELAIMTNISNDAGTVCGDKPEIRKDRSIGARENSRRYTCYVG